MKRILLLWSIVSLVVILISVDLVPVQPSYAQGTAEPTPTSSPEIQGFHLVSATEGWLLCSRGCNSGETNQLYWTRNAGQTWTNITPPNPNGASISGVSFVDNQYGVAILVKIYQPANTAYSMAQTSDGGKSWVTKTLSLFSSEYADFVCESLQFLDVHTGWLMLKQLRNTQFDVGMLFKTTDGGATWTSLPTPNGIGDPAYFVTDQIGWIVGRGEGSEYTLYHTQDGGQTWQRQQVGDPPNSTTERRYSLPQFVNVQAGLLAVHVIQDQKITLEFYITHDQGNVWQLDHTMDGGGAVALLDSDHWLVSSNGFLVKLTSGQIAPMLVSQDPAIVDVRSFDFVSPVAGWAEVISYVCVNGPFTLPLHRLLYTGDGGQTWQPMPLPGTISAPNVDATPLAPPLGSWSMAAPMATPRFGHTATLLNNGQVLVVGGYNGTYLAGPELYDPTTNTWSAAGSMTGARGRDHAATLLNTGRVLVIGGFNGGSQVPGAELYDPTTNTWSTLGNVTYTGYPIPHPIMVSLKTGQVLMSQGNASQLYDPTTKASRGSARMVTTHVFGAILLNDGRVLVTGTSDPMRNFSDALATVELYDPATDTWSMASSPPPNHGGYLATALDNGKVLMVGGFGSQAELYDPATDTWSAAGNFATACLSAAAILLKNGKVLVIGGSGGGAELYDPATNTWSAAGRLAIPRGGYTATLLNNGKVLVVGGSGEAGALSSAELYTAP